MNAIKKAQEKKTEMLKFRLTPAQYRQFLKESKKHKGGQSAFLHFLMLKYFHRDGI
jgi:hypothetical protein